MNEINKKKDGMRFNVLVYMDGYNNNNNVDYSIDTRLEKSKSKPKLMPKTLKNGKKKKHGNPFLSLAFFFSPIPLFFFF